MIKAMIIGGHHIFSLGPLPHSVHRMDGCSLNERWSNTLFILTVQWLASGLIYCILFSPRYKDRIINFLVGFSVSASSQIFTVLLLQKPCKMRICIHLIPSAMC